MPNIPGVVPDGAVGGKAAAAAEGRRNRPQGGLGCAPATRLQKKYFPSDKIHSLFVFYLQPRKNFAVCYF